MRMVFWAFALWCGIAFGQNILFADPVFKAFCVGRYDVDSDGEISVDEAAIPTLMDCSDRGIVDLDGIQYFVNLLLLDCSGNELDHLPNLPSGIVSLECSFNRLTDIPFLPQIRDLICSENRLTSLILDPSQPVRALACFRNQINSIPCFPPSLAAVSCGFNRLISLPTLPPGLEELACSANLLVSLPSLPASLKLLDCSANQLESLPSLPAALQAFSCSKNPLTSLPALPASLTELRCEFTRLTELPPVPAGLEFFYCSHARLTILPNLPLGLARLDCSFNHLEALPSLPAGRLILACWHNWLDVYSCFALVGRGDHNFLQGNPFDLIWATIEAWPEDHTWLLDMVYHVTTNAYMLDCGQ